MVKIEDTLWSNLGPKEKRVFRICSEITKWTEEEGLGFCEALRLLEKTTALFRKFSRRPLYHRREALIDDFWAAEELYESLRLLKKIRENPGAATNLKKTIVLDLVGQTGEQIIAEIENLLLPGAELTLIKQWGENDDVSIVIKALYFEPSFEISIVERFLPFLTKSQPHLLGLSQILQKELNIRPIETAFENTDFGLDFFDYLHKNEIAQKTININGLCQENAINLLKIVLRRITDTPRVYGS